MEPIIARIILPDSDCGSPRWRFNSACRSMSSARCRIHGLILVRNGQFLDDIEQHLHPVAVGGSCGRCLILVRGEFKVGGEHQAGPSAQSIDIGIDRIAQPRKHEVERSTCRILLVAK